MIIPLLFKMILKNKEIKYKYLGQVKNILQIKTIHDTPPE